LEHAPLRHLREFTRRGHSVSVSRPHPADHGDFTRAGANWKLPRTRPCIISLVLNLLQFFQSRKLWSFWLFWILRDTIPGTIPAYAGARLGTQKISAFFSRFVHTFFTICSYYVRIDVMLRA